MTPRLAGPRWRCGGRSPFPFRNVWTVALDDDDGDAVGDDEEARDDTVADDQTS